MPFDRAFKLFEQAKRRAYATKRNTPEKASNNAGMPILGTEIAKPMGEQLHLVLNLERCVGASHDK